MNISNMKIKFIKKETEEQLEESVWDTSDLYVNEYGHVIENTSDEFGNLTGGEYRDDLKAAIQFDFVDIEKIKDQIVQELKKERIKIIAN